MPRGQKEAFDTRKAIERLKDMVESRQMLLSVTTTTFSFKKLDTQIRIASHKAADGIHAVHEQRPLAYDELTKWTLMLSEARIKLYKMEAPSLAEALGDVEDGLRQLLSFF